MLPERWVVHCKRLDRGDSAIVYLRRYLYRGAIQERDIVRLDDSGVTYRWRDSASGLMRQRAVSGAEFVRLLLQHMLPKGQVPQPDGGRLRCLKQELDFHRFVGKLDTSRFGAVEYTG